MVQINFWLNLTCNEISKESHTHECLTFNIYIKSEKSDTKIDIAVLFYQEHKKEDMLI